VPGLEPAPFAEDTARQIDAEIKQLLIEAHARASDMLRERRGLLDVLAARLTEQEVVEGTEVRALVQQKVSPAPRAA
jgi:cell division protease FtsH